MSESPNDNRPRPAGIRIRLDRYRTVDEFIQGHANLFVRTGMIVPTRQPRPEGSSVMFVYLLANDEPFFRGEAVVQQHWRDGEGNIRGMVLRFTRLDRPSREIFERVLKVRETLRASAQHPIVGGETGSHPIVASSQPTSLSQPASLSPPTSLSETSRGLQPTSSSDAPIARGPSTSTGAPDLDDAALGDDAHAGIAPEPVPGSGRPSSLSLPMTGEGPFLFGARPGIGGGQAAATVPSSEALLSLGAAAEPSAADPAPSAEANPTTTEAPARPDSPTANEPEPAPRLVFEKVDTPSAAGGGPVVRVKAQGAAVASLSAELGALVDELDDSFDSIFGGETRTEAADPFEGAFGGPQPGAELTSHAGGELPGMETLRGAPSGPEFDRLAEAAREMAARSHDGPRGSAAADAGSDTRDGDSTSSEGSAGSAGVPRRGNARASDVTTPGTRAKPSLSIPRPTGPSKAVVGPSSVPRPGIPRPGSPTRSEPENVHEEAAPPTGRSQPVVQPEEEPIPLFRDAARLFGDTVQPAEAPRARFEAPSPADSGLGHASPWREPASAQKSGSDSPFDSLSAPSPAPEPDARSFLDALVSPPQHTAPRAMPMDTLAPPVSSAHLPGDLQEESYDDLDGEPTPVTAEPTPEDPMDEVATVVRESPYIEAQRRIAEAKSRIEAMERASRESAAAAAAAEFADVPDEPDAVEPTSGPETEAPEPENRRKPGFFARLFGLK